MKKLNLLVLSLLVVVGVAQSATEMSETVSTMSEPSARLSISPGLQIVSPEEEMADSTTYYGLSLSLAARAIENLYVGADLGFYRRGVENTDYSMGLLQLNATAYYRFGTSEWTARPFFGVSLGPTIASDSRENSESDTLFQIMARPGVDFAVSESVSLGAEGKLGLLDGNFAFLPQLSLTVGL